MTDGPGLVIVALDRVPGCHGRRWHERDIKPRQTVDRLRRDVDGPRVAAATNVLRAYRDALVEVYEDARATR